MRVKKFEEMLGGWFVGEFEPTSYKTDKCEVAFKSYNKGATEKKHYHKIATEITLITKGKVCMFEKIYGEGDILVIEPEEATSFEALEDTDTVVVKLPGVLNDKYIVEDEDD